MGSSLRLLLVVTAIAPAAPGRADTLVMADVTRPDLVPSYLIIAPRRAIPAVLPLAAWRAAHGHAARVAPVEAVYAAHRALPRHEAIRAFLDDLRRRSRGPTLRYVLLVGTADPHNSDGLHLPTWSRPASYCAPDLPGDEALIGDHPFAVARGAHLPDLAVGRFPARRLEEVETLVRKTLDYERLPRRGAWRRQVDLYAGQGGYGAAIDAALERLFSFMVTHHIPNDLRVYFAYANPVSPYGYSPPQFADNLTRRLSAGPALMVYTGHGGADGFDSFWWQGRRNRIMDASAVSAVSGLAGRTTVVSIACTTGRFDGLRPAIGERLVTSPGGPVAFIGASRVSQPYANGVLAGYLSEALVTQRVATIGDALAQAKRGLAGDQPAGFRLLLDLMAAAHLGGPARAAQRGDQLMLYNLLGDPALRNGIVPAEVTVEAQRSARPGEAVVVALRAPVASGLAHVSLTIPRDRMLPGALATATRTPTERQMNETNTRANDKVVSEARVRVVAGRAQWTVTMPRGIAGPLHLNAYVEGHERDAAGTREIRLIGSPHQSAVTVARPCARPDACRS
ncbi:MAG: hypothetical protein HY906_09600 [Deltaproteobacteria bacterium]|nr:hypothetical protein [Deltaproteobacteria bacterium]